MRVTFLNLFRKPVTVHYPTSRADIPGPLPRPAGAGLREGHRRGSLHRLPAVRVRLSAGGDQGRDAQEREAELREDVHARALRLRVLRAVRAGLPDRRHRHDEVVRHADRRSPRDAARQGSAARASACSTSSRGRRATCCATCRGRRSWRAPKRARQEADEARQAGRRGVVTLRPIAFWCLAVVLVGSALAVVLSKNLFHAVLWLALALTGTAGMFLLLDAEFLAAVQLLLYAGGIVTDRRLRDRRHRAAGRRAPHADEPAHQRPAPWSSLALLALVVSAIAQAAARHGAAAACRRPHARDRRERADAVRAAVRAARAC